MGMFKRTTSQAYNGYNGRVGIPINNSRIIFLSVDALSKAQNDFRERQ